jgi:hypothetical protein
LCLFGFLLCLFEAGASSINLPERVMQVAAALLHAAVRGNTS